MNVTYIGASAGSGKTQALAESLVAALTGAAGDKPACRPDAAIAMSFTRGAAAELQSRCRRLLVKHGHHALAGALAASSFGTVHSVCGQLVRRHALLRGGVPSAATLDETQASALMAEALGAVAASGQLTAAARARMPHLLAARKFGGGRPPLLRTVHELVNLARGNGLDAGRVLEDGRQSTADLRDLLPPKGGGAAIEAALAAALAGALASLDRIDSPGLEALPPARRAKRAAATTPRGLNKTHLKARLTCQRAADGLSGSAASQGGSAGLPWGSWASLCSLKLGASSVDPEGHSAAAAALHTAAQAHVNHPAFQADLLALTETAFSLAAAMVDAYDALKRARGVMDFSDQESQALAALDDPRVCAELSENLDLLLVDEFQDTNPLQLAIFARLARLARHTIWVGDPKQAIYGFRGADMELIGQVRPALERAVDKGGGHSRLDCRTLGTSYRSRAPLVKWVSDRFVPAFAAWGLSEQDVRLQPERPDDPPSLGPIAEFWRLAPPKEGRASHITRARGLAEEVRRRLDDKGTRVRRSREPDDVGPLRARDVAVLCRRQVTCRRVAAALSACRVPVQLAQPGLLATSEGRAVLAGLQLALAPDNARHRAEVMRWVDGVAVDANWVAALLDPAAARLRASPGAAAVVAAQVAHCRPARAVDALIEALGLAAGAGRAGVSEGQQIGANLAALRALAVAYEETCAARGVATGIAGLVYHMRALETAGEDWCGTVLDAEAVHVTTLHGAKGLEWPWVILAETAEVDRVRKGDLTAPQVDGDAARVDLEAPLAGRHLRAWPLPYQGWRASSPLCAELKKAPPSLLLLERFKAEELRLLYVAMTRAKDRLVISYIGKKAEKDEASRAKSMPAIFTELGLAAEATAARATEKSTPHLTFRDISCGAAPADVGDAAEDDDEEEADLAYDDAWSPPPPGAHAPAPAWTLLPGPRAAHLPARTSPSSAEGEAPVAGLWQIGPALTLGAAAPARALGSAVHAFFPAALNLGSGDARAAVARDLPARWGLSDVLPATLLEAAADALSEWARSRWPGGRWQHEVPVCHRTPEGTLLQGRIDMLVEHAGGLVIVDHKVVTGAAASDPREAAGEYGGQLAAYARALGAASGQSVWGVFVHLPLQGVIAELALRPR